MTNRCWKIILSMEIIFIVTLCLSEGTELNDRIKRDDGSYAKDFGGPVAQASGPEEGGNGIVETSRPQIQTPQPQVQSPPPSQVQQPVSQAPVAQQKPSAPVAPPGAQPGQGPKCAFEQKQKQVLFVIANNGRFRMRRDDGSFAKGFGGPVAQKSLGPGEPQEHANENQETAPQAPSGSLPTAQSPSATAIPSPVFPSSSDFQFLNTTFCQTPEMCFQKCQQIPQCNYFLRSFFNFVSYMYKVSPDKISEGKYTESLTYDSYVQKCQPQPSTHPPPIISMNEDPKQKFLKKLTAFNQRNGDGTPLAAAAGPPDSSYPSPSNATKNETKCIHLVSEDEARKEFDRYLNTFNDRYGDTPPNPYGGPSGPKTYENPEEKEKRYQLFKDNLQIVQRLNCQRKGDEPAGFFEVTEFSDQTYEEFISNSGGSSATVGTDTLKPDVSDKGTTLIAKCPKLNWADQGVVPPPRKQGKCGACYAFSTSDLIASQYHIDRKLKGQTFTLAPQYLIDCMKGPAALGCNGGRPIEVLRNFTKCDAPIGCNLPKEECYPYKGKKEKCKQEPCQETPKVPVRFATINDLDGEKEKENIAALLHWGPAVVIIDADQSWQFYGGKGILRGSQCGKMQNHAVLLTGYDFSGPIPYYIIKNSWGPKWGDKGFIKLEAGKNTCSVAKTMTFCCTHNCDNFKDSKDFVNRPNSEGCA